MVQTLPAPGKRCKRALTGLSIIRTGIPNRKKPSFVRAWRKPTSGIVEREPIWRPRNRGYQKLQRVPLRNKKNGLVRRRNRETSALQARPALSGIGKAGRKSADRCQRRSVLRSERHGKTTGSISTIGKKFRVSQSGTKN